MQGPKENKMIDTRQQIFVQGLSSLGDQKRLLSAVSLLDDQSKSNMKERDLVSNSRSAGCPRVAPKLRGLGCVPNVVNTDLYHSSFAQTSHASTVVGPIGCKIHERNDEGKATTKHIYSKD